MNEQIQKDISSRWFVRYPGAIFMIGIAYLTLVAWVSGIHLQGMMLLMLNPFAGIIYTTIAIFSAWELSLLLTVVGIAFLLFKGLMALPLSFAIILGAIIVAVILKAVR
jgi:prepilin signal peptidase PulO-like enzyme (type II secretory pathway)